MNNKSTRWAWFVGVIVAAAILIGITLLSMPIDIFEFKVEATATPTDLCASLPTRFPQNPAMIARAASEGRQPSGWIQAQDGTVHRNMLCVCGTCGSIVGAIPCDDNTVRVPSGGKIYPITNNTNCIGQNAAYYSGTLLAEEVFTITPAGTPTVTPTIVNHTTTPTASMTPTLMPSVTPDTTDAMTIDADSVQNILEPFVLDGTDIYQTVNTSVDNGGRAVYLIVPRGGRYRVAMLISAPSTGENSLYFQFDDEPDSTMVWDVPVTNGFEWRFVSLRDEALASEVYGPPAEWVLQPNKIDGMQGSNHYIFIRGREKNLKIRQISLWMVEPYTPSPIDVPKEIRVTGQYVSKERGLNIRIGDTLYASNTVFFALADCQYKDLYGSAVCTDEPLIATKIYRISDRIEQWQDNGWWATVLCNGACADGRIYSIPLCLDRYGGQCFTDWIPPE